MSTDQRELIAEALDQFWIARGDQYLEDILYGMADAVLSALQSDGWQSIEVLPVTPIQVEFFYGKLGTEMLVEPYRDERRELGYWDGAAWCHCGTGHEVHEYSDTPIEHLPTHWRPLPPAPAMIADQHET